MGRMLVEPILGYDGKIVGHAVHHDDRTVVLSPSAPWPDDRDQNDVFAETLEELTRDALLDQRDELMFKEEHREGAI